MTEARGMRRNISLSYWVMFFYHFFFFIPIWYEYETMFATPAMLGIIFAASHLVTVVLELPTGALADLIGRKKTLFFGYTIVAASWTFLAFTQNYYWLWVGYAINSVGIALVSGSDSALYYDSLKLLKEESLFSELLAKQGVVRRVAIVIGTLLGGTLFAWYFRLPYFLVGISSFVAAALVILYREPSIDSEKFSWENYVKQTRLGLKQLTKSTYLKDFSLYYLLVGGLTWYFLYFLNVAFATEFGFSSQERSILLGAVYMVVAVINYALIKKRLISKRVAYVMFPVLIVSGYLLGSFHLVVTAFLSIVLIQAAGVMRFSVLDQYAHDEFESKYRATAMSTLNMLVSIVFAVLSIAGGQIIVRYDVHMLMFWLSIVGLVVLTPTSYILLKRHVD